MDLDTLEVIVKKAMEECTGVCSFMFQGGEPTISGLDFYKNLIVLQKRYNKNEIPIFNAIQTNGYVIDREWADFFAENKFLVGVSLDGYREIHDTFRKDARLGGTFDRVMETIRILEARSVDYNILTVVTKPIAEHAREVYEFYREQGFSYLQFIPCLDEFEKKRGGSLFSLTPKLYAKFLKELFDCWYADCLKNDGVSIRNFDNYLMLLQGHAPENCAMSGKCSVNAVIEADGRVYPCDFYAVDEYCLGNLHEKSYESILSCETAKRFASETVIDKRCPRCRYFRLCRGGCRRDKVQDNFGIINYYCESYRSFFEYTCKRFAIVSAMKTHPYSFMNNK